MRYMIIVRAAADSAARVAPSVGAGFKAEMLDYCDRLIRAGALLDAARFRPGAEGWRVHYAGDSRSIVDGAFSNRERVAGYTLIEVRSREEAVEWTRRFPNPAGRGGPGEIEVWPLCEPDDGAPSAIARVLPFS